jgi:hypothetical protein
MKTLQMATGGAAAFIAIAMFMLAGDDDERRRRKGKTVEKNVEFMQGFRRNKVKYYIIPTKQRDEKGIELLIK